MIKFLRVHTNGFLHDKRVEEDGRHMNTSAFQLHPPSYRRWPTNPGDDDGIHLAFNFAYLLLSIH